LYHLFCFVKQTKNYKVRFEELALKAGFAKRNIPKSEQDEMYQADDIELWELRLKSDLSSIEFQNEGGLSVEVLDDGDVFDRAEMKPQCRVRVGTCTYSLNRVSNGGIGGDLWASSVAMSNHLLMTYTSSKYPSGMEGLKVLELGSGIGLVALTCRQLGAELVATDMPSVLPLLEENIARNNQALVGKGSVQVVPYMWGTSPPPPSSSQDAWMEVKFDLILCADCVYAQSSIEPLLAALLALSTPNTEVK
jgi:hypothetical protein